MKYREHVSQAICMNRLYATQVTRLKEQSKTFMLEGNDHAVYIMGLQKDSD